jgi:hypothetical protein
LGEQYWPPIRRGICRLDDQFAVRCGGSLLFVAVISHLVNTNAVAPVASLASLVASISRISLFWQSIDWQAVRWYVRAP